MLRMRKVMHRKHLLQYYISYIKPIIQYGILIYGCTHKSILNRILMVQKRNTRIIIFKRFKDPITDVMTEHKIYTVYELHYYELLKEVVKNLNGWSCLNLLPSNVPSRSTRLQTSSFIHKYQTKSFTNKTFLKDRLIDFHNYIVRMGLHDRINHCAETLFSPLVHSLLDNILIDKGGLFELLY